MGASVEASMEVLPSQSSHFTDLSFTGIRERYFGQNDDNVTVQYYIITILYNITIYYNIIRTREIFWWE